MSKELIREIVVNVVGKQAEPIADLLNSKKHVNEFNLAKKLEITINQTRNLLYKLSDQGLVSSIRKKDKKKGWYTYFWKIENLKAFEFLKGLLDQRTNQINAQIASREKNQFYVCERCNLEYKEENALFMDFTCDECGEIFKVKDNSKLVRALQRNLKSIDGEMKLVEIEIQKESKIFKDIKNKSHMYFVHSYEFIPEDKSVISATTDYSSKIVCSVERNNLFGTQFHPEKSDKVGLKIIDNFIKL